MAAARYKPLVAISIIVILACQAWSSAAYNNQQTEWLTKRLSQSHDTERVRPKRHLEETITTSKVGWRASLVNEDHKLHELYGLSSKDRVYHDADKSRNRAWALDAKARAAPYYTGSGRSNLGRKALKVAAPALTPALAPSYGEYVEASPGGYSMSFSIGTPPQNFVAIADTGSDLVWLQCSTCTLCFNETDSKFNPANSSTYAPLGCPACAVLGNNAATCTPSCEYTYEYGDQSTTTGFFSSDTVTLESFTGNVTSFTGIFTNGTRVTNATKVTNTTIPHFNFGCGIKNNGSYADGDGIIGLARGPISFPSQLAPYLNNHTMFSYCLLDKMLDNVTATSPIIFGEAAVPANVSGTVYTPIQSPYAVNVVPYYYVNLVGITVGGVAVDIPVSAFVIDANGNGGTVFDSGTTYTTLNTPAYSAVRDEFINQITQYQQVDLSQLVGLDLCYDISGLESVSVPSFVFNLEKANLDLPFDNIFLIIPDGEYTFMCLAMMGMSGISIIGNTQQQSFQIVYKVDALQIGWVATDCTTL